MAYVELLDINKRYDNGYQAASNVNLQVEKGEFVVLLGPSGCGKSTTLRMIAGLETLSSGELRIDGERMNEVLPKYRDIAMVFQSYALYPHMTVYENMALSLKIKGMAKAEIASQIAAVAEMLHLSEFLQVKPGQLSGGQRQRVALGRAIVRRPKVFLFDEPLSNLDAKLRNRMRQELSALHKAIGATIIYVTHDQVEAMTMADKVVIMNQGKVQQIGTPLDLYHRPVNRFVAEFIGSPQMNLFEVQVQVQGEQIVLQGDSGLVLPLAAADFPALSPLHGAWLTLGCRPEACSISAPLAEPHLNGTLVYSENLGAESNLFVQGDNGAQYIVKQHTQLQHSQGQPLAVTLDTTALHFFDPQTGERLAACGETVLPTGVL
ncbi:sn-glycerol-3-phosphate ABC transporter ATP-binding protein UgpC [Serratia proteamaculans]|uniref:sn-glycerol-3-phosphate ABC transporter ATP-binding protein UgpC n=1 Tax=Serratia proteamaculans TaxID=28151 RepID=A0A7U0RMY5_SERPR|nr:sn-glycerol-3-phosphate ABC transporter ATP-binding protein UgpC [Serratia proteamaculans]MBO1504264.1 sn-glycerol-3-phosphate ABC transporter ATP-binding protein UgpC [Serratia proteamaculans]MDW5512340.1 sn-glycerol-3-phosphate ABC transporter ATP-binding protein UgpC [Serratia proteamaculans]QQX52578.1 sn-glycerol-3-phosphate ABC transporter ATP-binding protein UgpC [Serratia proteamaculans]